MSLAIRFQKLPPALENRVTTALTALAEGKLSDIQAASFFFNYFFQRLEPMYRDNPKTAQMIQDAVKNQNIRMIIPKLVDVTLHINAISDLEFTNKVNLKTPSMTFGELQVIEDILLARKMLTEALMENKIKIKKMADILRWLAPIATLQTEAMLEQVREEDLTILDKNLREIGY
ncbi:MAG: hypothetical protein ACTSRS_18290 [Candidatus Helarchaeota archaeon]